MKSFLPALAGLLLLFSLSPADGAEKHVRVSALRIVRQIPGWTEESKSFIRFTPEKLYDLIDGGAPEYIDRGLKEGFFQRLKGPDSMSVEIYTEDFGSEKNARAMFSVKRPEPAECIRPAPNDTLACAVKLIGAWCAYAAADRFYFELTLTGTADEKKALAEMGKLLAWYRLKVPEKKPVHPTPVR